MGRDEQIEEREVLNSIFPDEITDISDNSYHVAIVLDTPQDDSENVIDPPSILLNVTYPDTYPDTAPMLALSSPPNTRPHPLFDLRTCSDSLLSSLDPIITENLGMAMVFTLISALKENAEAIMVGEAGARQAVREMEASKAEEEENRKFHGEKVTKESFLRWREGFLSEKEEERRKTEEAVELGRGKKVVKGEDKLTGKELWERGLVGRGEDEDLAADSIEGLRITE